MKDLMKSNTGKVRNWFDQIIKVLLLVILLPSKRTKESKPDE
ncbi:hypothetical protein [Terribacillus sp. 7520-G]|nr:hypothetical protein [Terribacillus sp. 7520-G]